MSNHSDKSYPERPISELARTGHRISNVRTHLCEADQFAANAIIRRALRIPHAVATRRTSPSTSPSRSRPIPSPSLAPQGLQMLEQSFASRAYSGALPYPMVSPYNASRDRQPTNRSPTDLAHYPSSPSFMTVPEVPPIPYTLHAPSHVHPRHRSGASDGSGHTSDARSTSSARDVRQVDGYSADASSNEEDTADEAIVEAGPRAASREAAGHRNGDVAAEGGDEDDLVLNIEPSGSTRSDSDTPAHDSFGENVDVDELDSEEYADVRTRYHHTGIWHDAQGLFRVLRDRDGRQEVEVRPRYSLIRQTVAGDFLSTAAYPLAGEREAPSSSGDEHDRGDEGRVHPQVDLQLEQASWTSTSATMSSSGITSQREPVAPPAIIRPSIHNLINAEDMEVPRPWGSSALTEVDQRADPYATAPREAERHVDTSPTYPAATDARGQGPGSQLSLRLSPRPPIPQTAASAPSEGVADGVGHDTSNLPFCDIEAAFALADMLACGSATNVRLSPRTDTRRLYPGSDDVLSPGATSESATLTGGTINISLPKVDPTVSTNTPLRESSPMLPTSEQFVQPRQISRSPSPHSPPSRPRPLPPSAPHQESSSFQPCSFPSDSSQWPPWRALFSELLATVGCVIEGDEAPQDVSHSPGPASNLLSTSRMVAGPVEERSEGKKNTKGKSSKKNSKAAQARSQAHDSLARTIEAAEASEGQVNILLNAFLTAAQLRGEDLSADSLRLAIPYDRTARPSVRMERNCRIFLDETVAASMLNDAAGEGGMADFMDASVDDEEAEEGDNLEQVEDVYCVPALVEVFEPKEGQTAEERIEELKFDMIKRATQILKESEARAIASDLNNPPAFDADGQPEASTSAQPPPVRYPRDPLYPAQTHIVVFIACEDAYTYTVVSIANDASPLRVLGASESPLSPSTTRVHLGEWQPFSRSLVEAAAMEEEGIPEETLADVAPVAANVGTAHHTTAAGDANHARQQGAEVNEAQAAGNAEHKGADENSPGAGTSPQHEAADEEHGTRGKQKKVTKRKAAPRGVAKKTGSKNKKQDATSKDGKKTKKKAAPKRPPPLLSRAEILAKHQRWKPIRRGMPSAEELIEILAMVTRTVELAYPHWARLSGTRTVLGSLDFTEPEANRNLDETEDHSEEEDSAAQSTDSSTQGEGARPSGRKRGRTEDEDKEANDAGPAQPAKKRKTALATSSQQAPAASLPQPPAPRGNKRRRDEATEDAAPARKRTRTTRGEEAPDDPTAHASTMARSQAPRMIAPPGTSVVMYPSLEASRDAAAKASRMRESASRQPPRTPMPRQAPRPPMYRPPPEQPIAGPSRAPVAGPSRPSRKRRRGDETDDDEDDDDYVEEGGPVTWESGRRAKKPKKQ